MTPEAHKGDDGMPQIDEPVYFISVAAKLVEVHPQTLRLYERLGLVRPARSRYNIRLYSQREVERLRQVQRLTRDLGVNLAGVEVILDLLDKMERMRTETEDRLRQMIAEIERLQSRTKAAGETRRG